MQLHLGLNVCALCAVHTVKSYNTSKSCQDTDLDLKRLGVRSNRVFTIPRFLLLLTHTGLVTGIKETSNIFLLSLLNM